MEKYIHKILTILIIVSITIIGINYYKNNNANQSIKNINVGTTNLEGKQLLEVTAKGGYSPIEINAKADTNSILRIKTANTFDCSSSLVIPELKVKRNLPPSGITDIDIPAQKAGTKIAAACAMGMYTFNINFN